MYQLVDVFLTDREKYNLYNIKHRNRRRIRCVACGSNVIRHKNVFYCEACGDRVMYNKAKVGIFIQCRVDSVRLPYKALLPLKHGNMIQHVMRDVKCIDADIHAIVTDRYSSAVLQEYADKEGFEVFTGPSKNVLERFCKAIDHYKVDHVMRVTGDNPSISFELAQSILTEHLAGGYDLSHYLGNPIGTGVEVVKSEVLKFVFNIVGRKKRYHAEQEHVTRYIYLAKNDLFDVHEPVLDDDNRDVSITVDTREQYEVAKIMYDTIYNGRPLQVQEILEWRKQHESLIDTIMDKGQRTLSAHAKLKKRSKKTLSC